jgi:hypothetical protein
MVILNENEDIYTLIRQNNTFAIRLWLDNITNDIHQRFVCDSLKKNFLYLIVVMNMVLLFFIGQHGTVVYQSFKYYFNEVLASMPSIAVEYHP